MVNLVNIQSQNINRYNSVSFGEKEEKIKKDVAVEGKPLLMYQAKKRHPITTSAKINGDKLVKAFTKYPTKGLKGSKNANFYEFLTMGIVPYLAGSATMIAVFNGAAKFFKTPDAVSSSKIGKKMGIGVALYGVAKTLSKKLIEAPVNMKYGIDVNVPYKKEIDELPEKDNKDNLKAYEYHKAYESVDFPYWDLFYDNKSFGNERDSYFKSVGKKMGLKQDDLEHADQKVKPLIREKIVKTKLYSTLSSYLWAATGVAVAMQKPFERLVLSPSARRKNAKILENGTKKADKYFAVDFGKKFVESCKAFVNNPNKPIKYAGRALLGAAIGMTLLGNFATLFDFNKGKGSKGLAVSPLIDESKEKVVC